MRDVAGIIAEYRDWPALYDPPQLANNEVPIYAASLVDDIYVDRPAPSPALLKRT